MNKAVQLPSGKIIDLSRFVALIPNDETAENHQHGARSQTDEASVGSPYPYSLLLDGYAEPISLNFEEASSIKKYLQVETEKKHNGTWDREEQLRLNQPKMKKLKEKIERMKQEQPSAEKAEFFESFKKTMDAHRSGQKLYEH